MAAEDADSAEQALTLEFYCAFLKSQDRAAEAEPLEARAKTIRREPHQAAWGRRKSRCPRS